MKILIISQNTCPFQGARAFRTAELSEQLAKMGHHVTLYTVHGTSKYADYEKETKVKMKNIRTILPVTSNDSVSHPNIINRLLYHYLHRVALYPEIELMYRIKSIIRKERNVDLLITIAFPHTIHFGAARAKKKCPKLFPKQWIADCGDPFVLNPMQKTPHYFEKNEREWCGLCDYITVPTTQSYKGYFPEYHNKIRVIPQGFNFEKTPIAVYSKNRVPTFIFAGGVYPGKRDVRSFLNFLLKWDKPYKFKLFMHTPLEEKYELESNHQIEYVVGKGRKDIIMECSKADFLVNVKNPSSVQTPSKLIDYGIAGRPILDISNDFCEQKQFEEFCQGDYSHQHRIPDMEQYKIENVADQFIKLANNIL